MLDAKGILAKKTGELTKPQQIARENMLSLIRLRGEHSNQAVEYGAGQRQVDVMVHGTFARGARWMTPFGQQIAQRRPTIPINFQWSGGASERDRQQAGRDFGGFVRDIQNPLIAQGRGINAIGHSHGGNVIGHAVSNENAPINLRRAVLLATPHMSSMRNPNTAWSLQGVNRVGQISSFSAPNDLVQSPFATLNEWVRGNPVIARRAFNVPGANNPPVNITLPPQGQNRISTVLRVLGGMAAVLKRPLISLGLLGAAHVYRGVRAHGDLHGVEMVPRVRGRL